jgi:HAD superfamily hydrolase (TIGR01509 family)
MNQIFFRQLGANISREEHQTFTGMSATKMWSFIQEKYHLPQSVEELKRLEKELKYDTLTHRHLEPTVGVVDFLTFLKNANHTLTIASSGSRMNIQLIVDKLGITNFFDFIVSGEDVVRGKPEPDIFLKVASNYHRHPQDCIVIEDSTNGVRAAKAADMFCVGYNNPDSGNQDLTKADVIIHHFSDKRLYDLL